MQRRIGHNVWDAEGCFCCAVQLLLVPSNITLLLRSISDVFSREQISVKDIDTVSLNSPAAAWSHSKHVWRFILINTIFPVESCYQEEEHG